jgi:hypothetical protein
MTPSVDAAYRIAQALGVAVDDLCGTGARRDALQEASRAILSFSRGDGSSLKRAVRVVDELRTKLRDGKTSPSVDERTDGKSDGAPRVSKSTTRDDA